MNLKTKIFLLSIPVAILAYILLYWYQGVFNKPVFEVKKASEKTIYGKLYQGDIKHKKFRKTFNTADSLKTNNVLSGDIAALYYNDPEKDEGHVKALIGILVKDSTQKVPDIYKQRTIARRDVLQAVLNTHVRFAPQLYDDMKTYAKAQNLELQEKKVLEIYPEIDSIIVQMPLIAK